MKQSTLSTKFKLALFGSLGLAIALPTWGCAPDEGVAAPAPTEKAKSPMIFTEKAAGKKVEVPVGEVFELRLESNASTGYSWNIIKQDKASLELQGEPQYVSPEDAAPGTPGLQAFQFKVKRAGESRLELGYARPWEKDKPPVKTFSFVVVGKNADK